MKIGYKLPTSFPRGDNFEMTFASMHPGGCELRVLRRLGQVHQEFDQLVELAVDQVQQVGLYPQRCDLRRLPGPLDSQRRRGHQRPTASDPPLAGTRPGTLTRKCHRSERPNDPPMPRRSDRPRGDLSIPNERANDLADPDGCPRRARGDEPPGPRRPRSSGKISRGRTPKMDRLRAKAGMIVRDATMTMTMKGTMTSTSTSTSTSPGRIVSMDQFRGYTVAGMCVVNFLGGLARSTRC